MFRSLFFYDNSVAGPFSVPLDHNVAEPVCHSDNSVAGPPMLLWQQCCVALLVSPCPSTIFGACNSWMQRTLQFKIWTKSCPKPLELAIIQGRAHHAMCTCWVLVCTHMFCHLPPQTVTSKHWRRIYTEEKAKVVAAAWGYNIYLIPCRTRSPGWFERMNFTRMREEKDEFILFFSSSWGKIAIAWQGME